VRTNRYDAHLVHTYNICNISLKGIYPVFKYIDAYIQGGPAEILHAYKSVNF